MATITLESHTAIQCKSCRKWLDGSRIWYGGMVSDHYAEYHPEIVAQAIADGTADDPDRWAEPVNTGPVDVDSDDLL